MSLIIVHRFLQSFLLPPFNSIIIIVIGLIFRCFRKSFGKWLILFGCTTLYLQSTPIFAYSLNKSLELPKASEQQIKEADAIIVLGGGVKFSNTYHNKLEAGPSTLIRTHYAAVLAHKYPDKIIIASGGYTSKIVYEGSVIKDTLINDYKVTNEIIVEHQSRNTDENAKYSAEILENLGIKKARENPAFYLKSIT